MIKKIIGITLALMLFCGVAFAGTGPLDTMGKAFSKEGNATVGMGDVPWQHKLLYPLNDRMMREIRDFIADEGTFRFDPWLKMMVSWVQLENGDVVARIGRLGMNMFFFYLRGEEMFVHIAEDDTGISCLTAGQFARMVKEKNKFPVVMAGSGGFIYYIFRPGQCPSVYATIWRKYMFNFYVKYVNPDWMKDSYAQERKHDKVKMFLNNPKDSCVEADASGGAWDNVLKDY